MNGVSLKYRDEIEQIDGNEFTWNTPDERTNLGISETAWNKIIHQGIKPIKVFAHPILLMSLARSTGYYRMLSMVSQKSTSNVGVSTALYEIDDRLPAQEKAVLIARQLNAIVSQLIETDIIIDFQENSISGGMAAGSQAQGSWQNRKGKAGEEGIGEVLSGLGLRNED